MSAVSIYTLAKQLDRHYRDVHQDVTLLMEWLIIEHNLDVIKTADWVIDLEPEGGSRGGQVIATGVLEQVAKKKGSVTGEFLGQMLDMGH